jgi:hypothetical protein
MNDSIGFIDRRTMLRAAGGLAAQFFVIHPLLAGDESKAKPPEPINFRKPKRQYKIDERKKRTFLVEQTLVDQDKPTSEKAIERLNANVDKALETLPAHCRGDLGKLKYFIMHGPNAPGGGKDNGLEYVGKELPNHNRLLEPRWGDAVVVYHAHNYVVLSDLWALKAVVHELGHAYHMHHWRQNESGIMGVYENAMKKGLYRNVRDVDGAAIEAAYATTNQLEYFAELSCMYFARCNYRPFDRDELREYDPEGYRLMERYWKVKDGKQVALRGKTT